MQIDVELTFNPELTFCNSFNRLTVVDQAIRVVLKAFSDDISNVIASSHLYTQNGNRTVELSAVLNPTRAVSSQSIFIILRDPYRYDSDIYEDGR